MNSIFYVTNDSLTDNSGQFTPTVLLTDQVKAAISDGTFTPRKGQWLIDGKTGVRAQFAGVKKSKNVLGASRATVVARPYKAGQPFSYYQSKLAA